MIDFAGFLLCATLIFISGRRLSFYGHLIAHYTGLEQGWIGLILLATVTSLPELFVGISSSAIVQSADLAVGDVLGSCAFNLAILSLLDWLSPSTPLSNRASVNLTLSATLGIILLALVGLGIFLPQNIVILGWVGIVSLGFLIVYIISIFVLYRYQRKQKKLPQDEVPEETLKKYTLKKAIGFYVLNALLVVAAALLLPHFAENIALLTGLGESFVGTLFLAASTSLPEVAVSLTAIRMGFVDLAVGNLLGSNIFNILILSIDDMFYTPGNLLKDASEFNIISVFSVIIMTAIAIAGLIYRPQKKPFWLAWDSLLILLVYFGNLILLYKLL